MRLSVRGVRARQRCSRQMSGAISILIMIMRDPCTLCRAQSSCSYSGASSGRQLSETPDKSHTLLENTEYVHVAWCIGDTDRRISCRACL